MKLFLLSLLLAASPAFAGDVEDSALFRQRFINEARALTPASQSEWLNTIAFVPDENLQRALHAATFDEMIRLAKPGRLSTLVTATAAAPVPAVPASSLEGRTLTIVVVPGVLAEFISTRAFEEVFERPSAFRDEFAATVAAAKAAGNPSAFDNSLPLNSYDDSHPESAGPAVSLDELLSIGELDVHGARVRVILFNAPFASLETLGSTAHTAEIFSGRLEKYLALTGSAPLTMLGYSRGTPISLEMLAQAKRAGKPWVNDVKAMISLSGVVLGSAIADDAVSGSGSPISKLLNSLRDTTESLEKYPDGIIPGWLSNRSVANANDVRFAKFGEAALPLVESLGKNASITTVERMAAVDPRAPLGIVTRLWAQLGLSAWHRDYNHNVDRFRYLARQLRAALVDISSGARQEWFRHNALPLAPTYYAVGAAMADPGEAQPERSFAKSPLGYAKGSFDDEMLKQNRRDYEALSGIALNDSQVSSIQAAFPATVLENLNAENKGLKTKFLAVAGTHHWGVALREVNHMRKGPKNGFPREALLRALVVQVLEDQR
jgi:hypothetical protein